MAEQVDEDGQEKEWKAMIEGQDKRLESLLNTAFQLANYYFVFQGVILAALLNGKSLTCENRWFLFTLSLIAIILNLCALIATGNKYINVSCKRDETWRLYNSVVEEEERSRSCPPPGGAHICLPPRDLCFEMRQRVLFASCLVMFVAFAAVTLAGCLWIGCRHEDDNATQNYNMNAARNCIKICDAVKCIKFCSQS